MVLDTTKVGILRETTWGTSLIDANGDTTYLLGVFPPNVRLPYPTADNTIVGSAADSRLPQDALINLFKVAGSVRFNLLDGWPLWWIFGASSTVGSNPYTHTITAATPGNALPSITVHHELLGTGETDWLWQLKGVRAGSWRLTCEYTPENPLLWLDVGFVGKEGVTTAVKLDNDPIPRITGALPFHFGHLAAGTKTWKAAALNNLIKVEIFGNTNVFNIASDYTTTPTGQVMPAFSPTFCHLTFKPPEGDLFLDDLIAGTKTGDLVLKWERGANDYIQFNGTNCALLNHPVDLARNDAHSMVVEMFVTTPTWEVKDSLAGSVYGE